MSVSHMAANYGIHKLADLIEEIRKCDVLCSNCHHITHRELENGNT